MGINKGNFEETITKYYLSKGDEYSLRIKNALSEIHHENIKKIIEQNTDIFSVFHYETTSLFAIKKNISYWLVREIYSQKYAIINSNREFILPFDYYKNISISEDEKYIICDKKILFDFDGKLIRGNLINNKNSDRIFTKKAITMTETIMNTISAENDLLNCLEKYYNEDIKTLIADIKNLENSNILHSFFDYNGSRFFTDGCIKKYFALKEKDSDKWGLMNIVGKLLTPFVYDDLGGFVDGEGSCIYMGILSNDGYRMGLLDSFGNVIVQPISECTVIFSNELAVIKQNGKFGYVNVKGNIVIPVIYNSATDFKYGKAFVKLNNEAFYINKKGEKL